MIRKVLKSIIGDHSPILLFYYKIKAWVALVVYRFPSAKIKVIGITGTNGKTTTVNLVAGVLSGLGYKVGFTSTLNYRIGKRIWTNTEKMTTQSPFVVQKMLREMVNEKCDFAIVEVTSHAVVQSRIYGINFDVGVITNLTGDHIEYHGSFENYMRAKGQFLDSIFSMRRKRNTQKALILNADDSAFDYFNKFKGDQKIIYGIQKGQITASDILFKNNGTQFTVTVPNDRAVIETKLIGDFNVYNALAAISTCISLGFSLPKIVEAFKTINPVFGRYEPVDLGQKFSVILDYAHTPDALEKLCILFRPLTKGRLILIFGCTGGGRDKSKRPEMGKVADKFADIVILTNDDPYDDDQCGIINDIAVGIKRKEPENLIRIVDRESAIRFGISIAKDDDTILIAGKGGEEVIAIGNKLIPYDDRKIVRAAISELRFTDITL